MLHILKRIGLLCVCSIVIGGMLQWHITQRPALANTESAPLAQATDDPYPPPAPTDTPAPGYAK